MRDTVARQRVIVSDGDERSALAAARSLLRAGHDVLVVARTPRSLAGSTRGARSAVVRDDPLADAPGYVASLAQVAREFAAEVLLPVTDASVEAVLEHRALLPGGVTLPLPALPAYRAASDKVRMMDCARRAGLDVPISELLDSPDDVERVIGAVKFPVIVKPHRSVAVGADGIRHKLAVSFAADAGELRAVIRTLPACAYPLLVQQRVRGPGEGLFALRWDGQYVATFAHRRLREKPPAGGVSVYRESIDADPRLLRAACAMLDELDWQGAAMIECKRDLGTGRHVFMEVNGRLWGSLQLAVDAGLDFPALLVASATGRSPSSPQTYRSGVRSRWFWGDVDHLYMRLTKSASALHLDGEVPSRLAVLREVLRLPGRQDHEEIWRWRDPGPGLLETLRRLSPR